MSVPTIAVCICTCKRPQGLRELLHGLTTLIFSAEIPRIKIVVVDNDSAQAGRSVCETMRPTTQWPIEYYFEERRGIPFARNRALKEGRTSQYIAFIDDDEIPDPYWLQELLTAAQQFNVPIVTGPVKRDFLSKTPEWVLKGNFFATSVHPDGAILSEAYTGNILLRTDILEGRTSWFDTRMALSGGSDAQFFKCLAKDGVPIAWAARAVVTEKVSASRTTFKWLVRRSYRLGCVMTFMRRDASSALWCIPETLMALCYALLKGIAKVVAGVFIGKHILVWGARHFAYAGGLVAGLFGRKYNEYETIHGG